MNIVMATTVHIPAAILKAVDRRARALRISRNRLIVRALERELKDGSDWSAGFFERLSAVDSGTSRDAGRLTKAVRSARRSSKKKVL